MVRDRMKLRAALIVLLGFLENVGCMGVYRMSVEEEITFRGEINPERPKAIPIAFAKHFQDGMVLQQGPARANIYGFASSANIGDQMTFQMKASTGTSIYQTRIVKGRIRGLGEWLVTLNAMDAGVTANITAVSARTTLTLNDVIFGDVWICSGQSNMQFTVIQMLGAEEEIADAHNYPDIRLMTVAMRDSSTPQFDLLEIEQAWTRADNTSVGGPAWNYFSAVCWLYGKAIYKARKYPIGLIATDWGGTPVEAWSSPDALASCNVTDSSPSEHPESVRKYVDTLTPEVRYRLQGPANNSIYNAMINPLLNMTIYGAIWYQGENDASGVMMNRYNCTFPAMIRDWRMKFFQASKGQTDPSFPFGFVQLAPNANDPKEDHGFPDIRWHQTADRGYVPNDLMPRVFMAVAMDLPDFNSSYGSVHPRDKKDVGDRLALSGLAVAYGQEEMFQGPFPQKVTMADNGLSLFYGDAWTLDIRETSGFEYLCSTAGSNVWQPTNIIANNATAIVLQWDICPLNETVAALRYEWRESPCEFKKCAVYKTVNNLPAPPFVINGPFM